MLKPLLIIIRILHEKNERLIKNLKKKNREIEEYKLEGAVLSRSEFFYLILRIFIIYFSTFDKKELKVILVVS